MNRRATRLGAVVTAVSVLLAVSACGRDDDDKNGGGATPGVTDEPCPDAVDEEKGCIYLGIISDQSGVFAGVGVPFTQGQQAYWKAVNEAGGIGDYEVDATTHVRDSKYDTELHAKMFGEIKDDVAMIAQSLGTAHTHAILRDAQRESILLAPASLSSDWIFQDGVIEAGTNYCAEAMNAVDYAVDQGATHIASIHFEGDYGDDAMVGARIAAEERGVEFTDIVTGQVDGGDTQEAAIGALLGSGADFAILSTGPKEMATIVGGALQNQFKGRFIGSIPTWNAAVLDSPAKDAIAAAYLQATSFPTWESDSEGAQALREAVGDTAPNDWFFIAWAGSHITKAVLEAAIDNDDLSREGITEAASELTGVDGDGMLPDGSANFAGDANDRALRLTQLNQVDPQAPSKISVAVEAFTGPTAEGYEFEEPCYLQK